MKNHHNPTVYLAGLISTAYLGTSSWREFAKTALEKYGFRVLTPLRGKDISKDTTDDGMNVTSASSKSIVLRDRNDVRNADVILMNLESFGSPRPLIGTIAEAAWAYDQQTPVVGIARRSNLLMRKHPFIKEFVSYYVETVEKGVDFLKRYYINE